MSHQMVLFDVELDPTGYIPRKRYTRLYPVKFYSGIDGKCFCMAFMTMKDYTQNWSKPYAARIKG